MSGSVGIAVIVAAILVCLGAGAYVMRLAKRRKSTQAEPAAVSEGRLAVVESTVVDPERRLLLVRCDNVEHLILVGGPADVVVENDVHRNRLGGRSMSRPFGGSASLSRGSHAGHDDGDAHAPEHPPAAASAEVKPLEPKRAHGNPPEAPPVVAAAPRLALAPVPAPASHANGKNGAAAPTVAAPSRVAPAAPSGRGGAEKPRRLEPKPAATVKAEEPSEARGAKLRLETSDQQFGRRDSAASPPRRAPHVQVAPAATTQPDAALRAEPVGLRPGAAPAAESRKPHEGADAGGLPAAQVPWPEADSIENEIVRALRVTPSPPLAQNGAQRSTDAPAAAKKAGDHPTTLGDLAERLEEALAREVRSAGQTRERLDLDLDAFAFEAEKPAEVAPPKAAPERKAESAPAKPAAPQPGGAKPTTASEPAPASVPDPAAVTTALAKPAPQPAKAASAESAKAAAPVPEPAKAPPSAPAPQPAAAKAAPPAPPPAVAKAAPPPEAAKTAPPAPGPAKAAAPAPAPAKIMAPAPEPEPRREPPAPAEHRQEEAPVINLSARRREPADPLEDEMARLLGELAGDTKR
jgi:hypothetical protein